jgi:hypothetical protein
MRPRCDQDGRAPLAVRTVHEPDRVDPPLELNTPGANESGPRRPSRDAVEVAQAVDVRVVGLRRFRVAEELEELHRNGPLAMR